MSGRDARDRSSMCPHGCGRRLQGDFRERAEGTAPSHSTRTHFKPQLPDDFCRYCSRALTDKAKALGEAQARGRSRGEGGEVRFSTNDNLVRM